MENLSKEIITNFIELFIKKISPAKALFLKLSNYEVFGNVEFKDVTTITNESEIIKDKNDSYQFILGDTPFGMGKVQIEDKKIYKNWSYIYYSSQSLGNTGIGLFLCEPILFSSYEGKNFLQVLEKENIFVNAVFKPPKKLLYPYTSFLPYLIAISRIRNEKLFISEIDENSMLKSLANYFSNSSSENLAEGILLDRDEFDTFEKYSIESEIKILKSHYKEYREYKLSDISFEINLTKTIFSDKPNSIYIPKIGNSPVISTFTETKLKHQNYFQVVLKDNIVRAKFLELFYRSDLGRLVLNSLTTNSFIPHINKSSIEVSYVTIPDLKKQDLIIYTNAKLMELRKTIYELEGELSLNLNNAETILEKFDSIQIPLKNLNEEDKILNMIRKGESKYVEFKETFSKNLKTNQKDAEIQKSSIKTIVGFLNAEGGTLLIGVNDRGTIEGIEKDIYHDKDKYLLNFKDVLRSKIGSVFYDLIHYDVFTVIGKKVLKVECDSSTEPCFYEDKDFYVRTNPATDKLEGNKLIEYIKRHFKT